MALKPLLFDGSLDGGTVVRHRILVDDLVNDRLITTTDEYRIQHISGYSRSQIGLVLARQADALNFSLPFQQYFSPDFPSGYVLWRISTTSLALRFGWARVTASGYSVGTIQLRRAAVSVGLVKY